MYLDQSISPLPESCVSVGLSVLYSRVSVDLSPEQCTSRASIFTMDQRRLVFGVIPSIHEVPPRDPSGGVGQRMVGYPMGRSDSSKPTPDGQPQQHFGGSHVSPRDQVGSRSGI
ncbi:hypothetical protein B296_00026348 [Ensete ventricosum]|uniref:Uncharacterized protein n=1 Tax=Ensete ventricosum TaxID=4639 RepID=A0A426ZNE3_ENSVE|nr:hypothetical protein B296_00026348 [Ensete ventricosum]